MTGESRHLAVPRIDIRHPLTSVSSMTSVADVVRQPGLERLTLDAGFVAPFGWAFFEAIRLEARDRGTVLSVDSPLTTQYKRSFAEIIGFGGAGIGSDTTVRLRRFRDGEEADIGRYLVSEWAGRATRLTAVEAGYVVGSVTEIFANALTHAHSPVGVVACGQYFPANGDLHLSVVDLGIGIPASVAVAAGRREEEIDPAAAIEWAFESGHSSIGTSRGLGLANLEEFIRRNGATLHVFSGRAYAALVGDVWRTTSLDRHFPGTLVDLQLPTNRVRTSSRETLHA